MSHARSRSPSDVARLQPAAAPAAPAPYAGHWEHLDAELEHLDALLRELVRRAWDRRPPQDGGGQPALGQGLFIADDEVASTLRMDLPQRPADELREELRQRVTASVEAGVDLPLVRLASIFGLSHWELLVVVLCLAVELDPRYERIYGYLQDDVTRKLPGGQLAADLLGEGLEARASGLALLGEQRALRRANLVEPVPPETSGTGEVRLLRLEPRIRAFLLGDFPPPAREWLLQVVPAGEPARGVAASLAASIRGEAESHLVALLHGGDVTEARAFSESVCGDLGIALLVVDLSLVSADDFDAAVRDALREGLLTASGVLLQGADAVADALRERELRLRRLTAALDDLAWLAFVAAPQPLAPGPGARVPWLPVALPEADLSQRADRWRTALASAGLSIDESEADSLAARYRVAAAEIDGLVAAASGSSRLRPKGRLELADVELALRATAGSALAGLARRIVPRYSWDDIVLPADHLARLHEIEAAVRSRRRVLADWGFGEKLSRGRGISALFTGGPGTGKTMAAEIIAGALGLDLYVVDLATVVSKYIGETEKNLSRIFDAAESTSTLLFFDEADALFGKRSEVKDAHDRYANIETGYLLQRIETYTGLAVLSTNLSRNLDEAFLRRLLFIVAFPFPEPAERERIWRGLVPARTPLAKDIDWKFLAGFSLAGGNIKGAVVHAAYQAAAANRPLGMADLVRAVGREFDKLGKVVARADFGPYGSLLENAE